MKFGEVLTWLVLVPATVLTFALALYLIDSKSTYLVESSGVVVNSVTEMQDRGHCLVELENKLRQGPQAWVYQCVDKK